MKSFWTRVVTFALLNINFYFLFRGIRRENWFLVLVAGIGVSISAFTWFSLFMDRPRTWYPCVDMIPTNDEYGFMTIHVTTDTLEYRTMLKISPTSYRVASSLVAALQSVGIASKQAAAAFYVAQRNRP